MDSFSLNMYLRAVSILAILGLITLGVLWGGGRLLRTSVGDVWWLRWGPKIAYSILLMFGFPAIFIVRYGLEGLQVYVVTGIFAAIALFFAGLVARP
jgi:hypothetical protein